MESRCNILYHIRSHGFFEFQYVYHMICYFWVEFNKGYDKLGRHVRQRQWLLFRFVVFYVPYESQVLRRCRFKKGLQAWCDAWKTWDLRACTSENTQPGTCAEDGEGNRTGGKKKTGWRNGEETSEKAMKEAIFLSTCFVGGNHVIQLQPGQGHRIRNAPSIFLPGRMAYEFDTDVESLGRRSSVWWEFPVGPVWRWHEVYEVYGCKWCKNWIFDIWEIRFWPQSWVFLLNICIAE